MGFLLRCPRSSNHQEKGRQITFTIKVYIQWWIVAVVKRVLACPFTVCSSRYKGNNFLPWIRGKAIFKRVKCLCNRWNSSFVVRFQLFPAGIRLQWCTQMVISLLEKFLHSNGNVSFGKVSTPFNWKICRRICHDFSLSWVIYLWISCEISKMAFLWPLKLPPRQRISWQKVTFGGPQA